LDAARYRRLKALLFEANRRPENERSAYLDAECADDPQLRAELDSLLRGAGVPTSALQRPVGDAASGALDFPEPPWHCGPYRILREIGRGGMGVVFEALDLASDATVAVKLVPPLFADAARLGDRFVREARIGQRIDHPNVVRTLDFGRVTVRGRPIPYLVMEFVEGRDLRQLMDDLGVVPESLLREIAEQVSRGLSAIHACGIVHRDLKPENILITKDRVVRIMDLGIAKLRDATMELTHEGQFIGSLHYASPEQCQGAPVGPPSDHYALGVLLYELATGHNPFQREHAAAAIHAHLEHVAPPIPDVSPYFAELVATLLSKDPAERFASGADLARVLAAGERSTWWASRRNAATVRTRVHLDIPRRTPLIGREREAAALQEEWDRAGAGAGGTVLVTGEAGIGKSRVVDEFLRSAGDAELHVLCGTFLPDAGLRGIADAVLARFPVARIEAALEPYLPDATEMRATFAALLRGDAVPEGRRELLPTAASRLLAGLAAERPTIWVLEDVHHAPVAAWRVIQSLARQAAHAPALLVLTARPPLDESHLAPIVRTERLRRVELARLPADEIGRLVEAAVDRPALAEPLKEQVARKSDGNPLFALAMLAAGGESPDAAVPSEIHDLIAARLAGLGRDQRAVLDAAAVQGVEFDAELLAGVVGEPVVGVLQGLAELERSRGIVRAKGRLYRFDHGLVQEVLYAALPGRLRAEYHMRVADRYARGSGDAPWGEKAEFLARHYLAGAEPERALPYVAAALEHLESRHLREAGLELIDRALDVAGLDEGERIRLLQSKEQLEYLLGRHAEQRGTISVLVERADRHGDPVLRALARKSLGSWHQSAGREPEALESFERATALAREGGDAALECDCRTQCGIALARLRRGEEALEAHRAALRIAEETKDRGMEAYVTANLGQALRHLCRYDEARAMYERAIETARSIGSESREMRAHGSIGIVFTELGMWKDAERHLRRTLEYGRRIGTVRFQSPATGNLGLVYLQQGRLADALECCLLHRRWTAEMGARRAEAVAIGSLGTIEMMLGNAARARTLLVDARRRAEETHAPQLVAGDELQLGRVALLEEDPATAKPHLAAAVRGYRQIGHRDFMARALIDLAACDVAEGRRGDAAPRLAEALEIGESLDLPVLRFGALVLLGEEERAREVERAAGERIPFFERLVGRARAGWREDAAALFGQLVAHAPPDARKVMADRVAFYRSLS